ncbi:MAG TPA: hypothetical protein VF735_18025 [Pyrinomonadaceae bacterium]|jgi:hypothetical protein
MTGKSNLPEREQAVRRGTDFLYGFASDPKNFAQWGSDLLNWLYIISSRARSAQLRRQALAVGRERARQWRLDHTELPRDARADTIYDFIYGSDMADRMGIRDRALKAQLRAAVRRFPPGEYLSFNPAAEPPPVDVPEHCACGEWNARGRKTCRSCRKRLKMISRYQVWYVALIRTYIAYGSGLTLGASYRQVLKWLPSMRPYRSSLVPSDPDFYDTVYAVTHVVYTLNDYDLYHLSPAWLPDEYEFLRANLKEAIAMDDPEMVGEFLDTLKSFGLGNNHTLIRVGTEYLLSRQNAEGSWGRTNTRDTYRNYHPTLCAVCGLLDYSWRGQGLSYPKLKPSLLKWAKLSSLWL